MQVENRRKRTASDCFLHLYFPKVVLVETVWVLETAYGLKGDDIEMVLDTLALNSAYVIKHEFVVTLPPSGGQGYVRFGLAARGYHSAIGRPRFFSWHRGRHLPKKDP